MAYHDQPLAFGRNYIILKALDYRLISRVAPAVAKAAIESGVAARHISDWEQYKEDLEKRTGRENSLMRLMTHKAKANPKKIVFAEGCSMRVLLAVQELATEKIAYSILIGNTTAIKEKIEKNKLKIPHLTIFDPANEKETIDQYVSLFYQKMQRRGVSWNKARSRMQEPNYIGLMMLETGMADAFISGVYTPYKEVLGMAKEVVGLQPCCKYAAGMHIATTKRGTYFLADTTVDSHPSAETLECVTVLIYHAVKNFETEPVIAMTSYSNFGEYRLGSPAQPQECITQLHHKYPEMIVDGEMHASVAFNKELRHREYPFSLLGNRDVNTIIFPNLSSGSVGLSMLQELGSHEIIGPILLGMNKPVHILQMGCTVRDIVHIATLAVSDAQKEKIDMCRI